MKVLKLRIEGFTCYRKPVELDFSELELFAITGPTGSGKSSLVDAIVFALYGKIPRLNTDLSSVISQGAQRMSVLLEFTIGERQFKVARRLQRNRGSQVILDELKQGTWEGIGSGVRQANQKINSLLGLDYDAFTRCIVLPQGAFEQFLQDSKGRQDILIRLLGLEILGDMQRHAAKEHEHARESLENAQTRLREEFAEINGHSVDELKDRQSELEREINDYQEKIEDCRKSHQEAKRLFDLQQELAGYHRQYDALLASQPEIKRLEAKISLAQKIAPVLPQLQQYDVLESKVRQWRQKYEGLQQRQRQWQNRHQETSAVLCQAENDYRRLPQLDKRDEELQQARQLQDKLQELVRTCQQQQKIYQQQQQRRQDVERQLQQTRSQLAALEQQKQQSDSKFNELSSARDGLQKFHGAENLVNILQETRAAFDRQTARFKQSVQLANDKQRHFQLLLEKFKRQEAKVKKLRDSLAKSGNKAEIEQRLLELEQAQQLREREQYHRQEQQQEQQKLAQEQKQESQLSHELEISRDGLQSMQSRIEQLQASCNQQQKLHQQVAATMEPYRRAREKYADSIAKQKSLQQKKRQMDTTIATLESMLCESQKQRNRLQQELSSHHEQWLTAYTGDLANSLREHLKAGNACPVCRQIVQAVPDREEQESGIVEQLQSLVERQRRSLQQEEINLAEYQTKLHSQQEALSELRAEQAEIDRQAAEWQAPLQKMEQQLRQWLPTSDYEQELQRLTLELSKVGKELERLKHLASEKNSFIREQDALLQSLRQRQVDRQGAIRHHQQEMERLQERIGRLIGSANLDQVGKQLQQKLARLQSIETRMAASEQEFTDITLQKEVAWQQCLDAEKAATQARKEQTVSHEAWQHKQNMVRQQLGLEVENIEQAVAQGLARYRQACSDLAQAEPLCRQLQQRLNDLQVVVAGHESTYNEIYQSLEGKQQALADLEKDREDLAQRLQTLTNGEDIEQLRLQLRRQKQDIENNYRRWREEIIVLQQQLKSGEQEIAALQEHLQEALNEKERLQQDLGDLLQELQLDSIEQLTQAKVAASIVRQWEEEVMQSRVQRQELEKRLALCERELNGKSITPQALAAIERQLVQSREHLAEKMEARGRITEKLQHARDKLQQAQKLEQQSRRLQEKEALFKTLSLDLRANRFQSYVLEEALLTLIEDGSNQFDILSGGRYAFALQNRDIYVVDRWNNDEIRTTKTLSGGETFLASLALALALAERIYQLGHRSGGSAALESLFLDEGFGSLDEEHLDIVVKALNNLQGTGRTIGIISHLSVLNNYLPARLVVHKSREGARVYKEGG